MCSYMPLQEMLKNCFEKDEVQVSQNSLKKIKKQLQKSRLGHENEK